MFFMLVNLVVERVSFGSYHLDSACEFLDGPHTS